MGKALDRYSIRMVVATGAVILSLAFAAIALTSSLWIMAAALVLPAAIGIMSLGPLTTATLASRWFTRRRGLALGIAAVATSGGGLVVVPLLSQAIHLYGWRLGLLYEAVAIGIIVVALALLVLRDSPAAAGLAGHPETRPRDAEALAGLSDAAPVRAPPRLREILTSRGFWIPSLALATISGTCQAIVITLVPYGIQLGFTAISAALLISAFSTGAAVTKVAAGLLADYVNQRLLLIAACLFMMLSLLALSFPVNYGVVFVSACLAGISLGCTLPTAAALIAARFGAASFGSVMGGTYSLIFAFAILEVLYAGTVFDRTGGYRPAFAAFFVLSLGLLAAVSLFGPEKPARAHAA